jgi:hypothetical protein
VLVLLPMGEAKAGITKLIQPWIPFGNLFNLLLTIQKIISNKIDPI